MNQSPDGAERRPDRRVQRTRRLLKGALLELIQEQGYESITVGQIADRADVGRSTFYSHFTSKDDLLLDGFDHYLMMLATAAAAPTAADREGFNFSLPLLRHLHSQRRFFLATILRPADSPIRTRVNETLARTIQLELEGVGERPAILGPRPPADTAEEVDIEARAHAVAGAFLGIAAWWLERAPRLPAEQVDRLFSSAVRRA